MVRVVFLFLFFLRRWCFGAFDGESVLSVDLGVFSWVCVHSWDWLSNGTPRASVVSGYPHWLYLLR